MQATLTLRQEALPIVKSSLKTRRKALEFNLRQYRTRLTDFERQHQMAWEFVLDAVREPERQLEPRNTKS